MGLRGSRDWGRVCLAMRLTLAVGEALSAAVSRLVTAWLGESSAGSQMLSMSAAAAALPLLTLLAFRFFPDPRVAALPETRRSTARTYFRGLFYGLAGSARMGFLLMVLDVIWFEAQGKHNPMQQMVEGVEFGPVGTLLLLLDAVVLAPVGEEMLFRGFLLPRLMVQKGSVWAVG